MEPAWLHQAGNAINHALLRLNLNGDCQTDCSFIGLPDYHPMILWQPLLQGWLSIALNSLQRGNTELLRQWLKLQQVETVPVNCKKLHIEQFVFTVPLK